MQGFEVLSEKISAIMKTPIFSMGNSAFTLWSVLYILLLLLFLAVFVKWMNRFLIRRLLAKRIHDIGTLDAVAKLLQYVIVMAGFFVILQTSGIDLSALTVLMGTLGIGVGFGLQHIAANMVSGLVILIERPIKVGDRIEVGNIHGDVTQISLRATTVVTNENVAIIVPNSEFTTTRVVNWSYTSHKVRLDFPVGVSYSSDAELVKSAMLEVADKQLGILKDPTPSVLLDSFGESSLNFILRVWTREYTQRPGVLRSEVNFSLLKKFHELGIHIPFPQRDVHIRTIQPGIKI